MPGSRCGGAEMRFDPSDDGMSDGSNRRSVERAPASAPAVAAAVARVEGHQSPPELLEVRRILREAFENERIVRGDDLPRLGDAALFRRMGREPRIHRPGGTLALGEQDLEHLRHAIRIDAGPHDVLDAVAIRLELILAAEARKQRARAELDRRAARLALAHRGREDAQESESKVGLLRFLHLLDRVPLRDVADLVAEHAGNLRQRLGALDQPAVDVDEAAGNGERVDLRAVDDVEVPVEPAVIREVGDRVAEQIHVLGDRRILDDRELGIYLARVIGSKLNFLLGRNPAACGDRACHQRGCGESSHSCSCARESVETACWARPIPTTWAVIR
jgi:hypothetical protein